MTEAGEAEMTAEERWVDLGRELMVSLDLEKELECPVCLVIPRSAPVFLCRAGHSVCAECFPRLPRHYRSRRCPVCPICQAKYCSPPARHFLAEKLLECVNRKCRFDFRGCDFSSKISETLMTHEQQCAHRTRDFQPFKRQNLTCMGPGRQQAEVWLVEVLQSLLQLTISFLAILIVLFFLVSLLSVLLGSMLSFARTVNSCKLSQECQLNDPNFIDLWNDDLKNKFAAMLSSLDFVSSALRVIGGFVEDVTVVIHDFASLTRRQAVDVSVCHPASRTSLYYDWPDTYLPSHMEAAVWRPGQANVEAGNWTLLWAVDSNIYSDGLTATRLGLTESREPEVVRAFMQWKLDMAEMPEHCQIVAVEMWHGRSVLQYWDSPLLYASREILVVSAITGWNLAQCPDSLPFGNITWAVRFNEEACRMKVDYIPPVNMDAKYEIY